MSKKIKSNALIAIVSCLVILFLSGCSITYEREYHDDIHIQLENHQGEIIIKEWQFLLGSGSEIYYKHDGKKTLLGKLPGGDDGFCPFKEGLYSVEVNDNNLTIEWCRFPGFPIKPWDKQVFELPSD